MRVNHRERSVTWCKRFHNLGSLNGLFSTKVSFEHTPRGAQSNLSFHDATATARVMPSAHGDLRAPDPLDPEQPGSGSRSPLFELDNHLKISGSTHKTTGLVLQLQMRLVLPRMTRSTHEVERRGRLWWGSWEL